MGCQIENYLNYIIAFFNSESCPKDGCPSNKILQQVPKLGPDDTVIVLLHGNAKVNNFKFFFHQNNFQYLNSTTNITSESRSNSSTCGLQKIPKTWILYFDFGL